VNALILSQSKEREREKKKKGAVVSVVEKEKERKRQKHMQKTYPFTIYKGYNSHYMVHNKNYRRNETKRQKHQSTVSYFPYKEKNLREKGISTSNIRQ
jgi:hypothetical protein